MNLKGKGELLLDVAGIGLAAMLFTVLGGRALNSPIAYRASSIPVLGPVVDSLRAVWNQGYDPAGEQ